MGLPKLDTPTFRVKIPSTNKEIQLRPFLVKEQKILYMALEANTPEEILRTIKQILTNCILTEGVDFDTLTTFDLEYLFVKLRSHSVGETVELKVEVENCECDPKYKQAVKIDLSALEITQHPDHNKIIKLTDKIGLEMKYPTTKMLDNLTKIQDEEASLDSILEVIGKCVTTIFEGDDMTHTWKDEEMMEFLESLSSNQVDKISQFFNTMPKLEKTITVKCKECGKSNDHVIQGLESFFG